MPSKPTCDCGHTDAAHLYNVGPCTHEKDGDYCGCEHFSLFRARVPLVAKIPALPMKNTAFTPWARQK
jgi:hypothetical protein